ncbi:MAG: tRNA (N(6)-L-threonylcarbamoyladenosine(37)-C(2))-methylthiotransferase [Candidatus Bathyarchaeota archaeon]|nr:MAG: tRNA (N(6)-L-threonylcarbamoyladenosine(37)-C(2))-methylthiotransferase [Candidatus Bathyarchaeota archaeon]
MKREKQNLAERVFIRSFGCPSNLADARFMERALVEAGYQISQNPSSADFLIYNTCAVKTPTENRMIDLLKRIPDSKNLVITGCLPKINLKRLKREVNFSGISGPSTGSEILHILSGIKKGSKTSRITVQQDLEPLLPNPKPGQLISVVPISYGCLGDCSYCCVKAARGTLRSYPIKEIVTRVARDVENGTKEIWLTGQDLGCYGFDNRETLPDLLTRISEIDGRFKVRVGMINPQHILKVQNELVDAFNNSKIFKFLHVPVQSGDDRILEYMNRSYSTDDFKQIVSTFREKIERITIATDVICGFPGEDEKAFENTLQLLREVEPDVLNISRFFPRPETPRIDRREVPASEKKKRSRLLTNLFRGISLTRNRKWIGWQGEILLDEIGPNGSCIGRNTAYRPVVIREKRNLGEFLNIRIYDAKTFHLLGEHPKLA